MNNSKHQKMTHTTFETLGSIITPNGVDTLAISKILRQLKFSEDQAEFVSEVIKQTTFNTEQIVTKKISEYQKDIGKNFANLATKNDANTIELKIEQTKSDLVKWVSGLMIANTGIFFTLIKFFN